MTPHHWPLRASCDECVEYVKRDQWIATLPHMTMDELIETLMGREHMVGDWQCEAVTAEIAHREAAAREAS